MFFGSFAGADAPANDPKNIEKWPDNCACFVLMYNEEQ
jgi:hypothetical protein